MIHNITLWSHWLFGTTILGDQLNTSTTYHNKIYTTIYTQNVSKIPKISGICFLISPVNEQAMVGVDAWLGISPVFIWGVANQKYMERGHGNTWKQMYFLTRAVRNSKLFAMKCLSEDEDVLVAYFVIFQSRYVWKWIGSVRWHPQTFCPNTKWNDHNYW